jgi:hypothetical protein
MKRMRVLADEEYLPLQEELLDATEGQDKRLSSLSYGMKLVYDKANRPFQGQYYEDPQTVLSLVKNAVEHIDELAVILQQLSEM